MARLNNTQYLANRKRLQLMWHYDMSLFAWLSQREQYALHEFFAIEDELSDAEAIVHRLSVSEKDESLPHRAGRAFAHIVAEAELEAHARMHPKPAPPKPYVRQSERHLTVRAVYRPKPDLYKLSRALIALALQLKEDAEDTDKAA